ncbi:MAG: IclR family transcriptional regulator [Pseudomonadota bacterium]|jgi:DNA-binding IclR family transcriptional regulator
MPTKKKEPKSSIQVIERLMKLLDALAQNPAPVGLKQLAHLTGLHPSSAHRILASMVEGRLVERVEPGTYRLGFKLLELGNLVKVRINVRQVALPYMQELAHELGETVNLILREGDQIVYVERIASTRSMIRVVQLIGARAPLHITAVGKVFLAEDGRAKCLEYARRTGLPVFTAHTISDPQQLVQEIEQIKNQGYALDREEAENGVCCIGAGIYGAEGKLVAGLSVSAPAERINWKWAARVKDFADRISRALGYLPGSERR